MAELFRYGRWPGDPNGVIEDQTRCIKEVMTPNRRRYAQCQRKRGKGPFGMYCGQHAKEAQAQFDWKEQQAREAAKTPEERAADKAAWIAMALAHRREHFQHQFAPARHDDMGEWTLSVSTNGRQWMSISLTREEWQKVLPDLRAALGTQET